MSDEKTPATSRAQIYRGDLKAVAGLGAKVAFVTVHPEGHATGLYRLNTETFGLAEEPLPSGGRSLRIDGASLWIAGGDRRLYLAPADSGKPAAKGPEFANAPTALALLADDRLAVLAGSEVAILGRKDGKVRQALELPEAGTCLAADPTGRWLVAGTARGTVCVFEAEGKDEFLISESGRLHEGAVTALLFEPDELRFLSAGADQKLWSTLARGKLEPEDKGRGNNHADIVTALIWGPGDRLLSGSRDGTIKSWPRVGNVKPSTVKDGVGKVVGLAMVEVKERPHLVAACEDNSLRFFPVDETGKVGDLAHRVDDVNTWARYELAQDDPRRREKALERLAGIGDARSIEVIAAQVGKDPDHGIRLMAAKLLGDAKHPRAAAVMEGGLKHADEAVRVATLAGLRKHLGERDLRPLDLALKAGKADVGTLAVEALAALAPKDDQALARLVGALDSGTAEVRRAALMGLEAVHDPKSPEADLAALASKHADVRRMALVRLLLRHLLNVPPVPSALRRRSEDDDAEVRRTAFLLTLYTREALLKTLRGRDPELERQVTELEGAAEAKKGEESAVGRVARQVRKLVERPAAGGELAEADVEPLLQATASRALDTCLRGARGLAVLGDPRAFGLLLQLSREEEPKARVEVCRAMAALDDPRAINRLRSLLFDPAAEVRDAAFSALAQIHQAEPLLAAESGLNAAFEDVRKRGLQALIAEVRKTPPKRPDDPARQLLARSLNDGFPAVRAEAFKAALNLNIGGGGPETLRFALRSIHADVRREVLTEVMAQVGQPWVWDLLLEFFNDPDPRLRADAFAFASAKTKGLEFLDAGLASRYADLRKSSVDALIKKHTPAAQALLVRALADEEKAVRLAALDSLVGADAQDALTQALASPHADVRLRAAKALARHGAPAALAPLLALATAPEPPEKERQADWLALAESALAGLGELGDPAALTALISLLDSPHAALRKQAARALVWVVRPETLAAPREALQHADPVVKYHAALALAYGGDASVAPVVFADEAAKVLSEGDRIAAALALGPAGEDRLVAFLDDPKEPARARALLLMMILELEDPRGDASRCLAGLSSLMPRVRLTSARALEAIPDRDAFARFVVELVNDRGDEPAWQILPATVADLARVLARGAPRTKALASRLLRFLTEKEQAAFDQGWAVFADRFAAEIAALRQPRAARLGRPAYDRAQLQELAFGAYVGLVRAVGSGGPAAAAMRVRQTAMGRIFALAKADPHAASAARPVLVQALSDPTQAVRLQAFEHLKALGMENAALAAEALEAGHTDLGVKGLELLTAGASAAEAQGVLERVMLARTDDLATEAAKLLMDRRGVAAAAGKALTAAFEPLRERAVGWLAAEYEKDEAARDLLRNALGSRYDKVRTTVAFALAGKKDPAAFDALVAILKAALQPVPQQHAINALVALGDPRAPAAFLDRIEDDPGGTALGAPLVQASSWFKRPEDVDRLLGLIERDKKLRFAAINAVTVISGYAQPVDDPEDERADRSWEVKQSPRHDAVLAKLMNFCLALGETMQLGRLIPAARWARGRAVDAPLAQLAAHPDEALRQKAVEALGWRLRKRGGSPDALLKAVQHREPLTQFLAAEGLAKSGRAEGLNVLLAAVDFLSDLSLRRRAVVALGELGDERALDLLLKLANEDGHALQEQAAEAIGHLGRSAKAGEIFRLLERHAKGYQGLAFNALNGLRWLNTRDGWQVIRRRAEDAAFGYQFLVVGLLAHDDEPATRDLLLRLLATQEDSQVVEAALESARKLWGPEALEPDYAVLQNPEMEGGSADDSVARALRRVGERGEPGRVFAILPKAPAAVREALSTGLLNRPDLPLAEARAAIGGADAQAARLAARILARAGAKAADAGPSVASALKRWRVAWDEARRKADREGPQLLDATLTPFLVALVRAAGRLGVARDDLIPIAFDRPDDLRFRPIRREAVAALAEGELAPAVASALEMIARGDDPEARALAAQALGAKTPERASALAGPLMADRVSFNRLARGAGPRIADALRPAAGQVHYQGVALPHLVALGEVETLAAVAADRKLPEATRLGAVEGLARLAREPAEAALRRIGASESEEEDLRKAAWRCLRRSKRLRAKAGSEATR